jgi:HEAT repeat protein
VGFRELLITSAPAMLRLARDVQTAADTGAVGAAVERFVAEVTSNADAEQVFSSDPELALYGRMLSDKGLAQRARGAAALGEYSHPAVARRLAAVLLDDPAESVRAAAVSALARLGTAAALDAATRGLQDRSTLVQLETVVGLLSRVQDAAVRLQLEAALPTLGTAAKQIIEMELQPKQQRES